MSDTIGFRMTDKEQILADECYLSMRNNYCRTDMKVTSDITKYLQMNTDVENQ